MPHLNELDRLGLNYYFQFTLNPYSKEFEPNVPPLSERIKTFLELAQRIGPDRVVWRYDPVILSSVTPVAWHLEKAESIAAQLAESTRRLIFSFYDFYGKGQGRLSAALKDTSITLEDITAMSKAVEQDDLAKGFKQIAKRNSLKIFSCSEDVDLSSFGIEHGACIDGDLIQELFGCDPSKKKDKNQRQACGCVESVDMGSYNTCHFRCSYCYANFNEGIIEANGLKHFIDSPSLLGKYPDRVEIQTTLKKSKACSAQLELF